MYPQHIAMVELLPLSCRGVNRCGVCGLAAVTVTLLLAGCALAEDSTTGPPTVVLVGATGNLAAKYLWQALFDMHQRGLAGKIYGGGTKKPGHGSEILQGILSTSLSCPETLGEDSAQCDAAMANFKAHVTYAQLRDEGNYVALAEMLRAGGGTPHGLLVYLSVSPDFYGSIAAHVGQYLRPVATSSGGWLRVVLEKPFGRDTASAAALAQAVDAELESQQVCKVDHYLGKQAVQAIAAFRVANRDTYEPLLNAEHVERVELVMAETEDCEGRTFFYERYGAVRDVLQNHVTTMLALLAGELRGEGVGSLPWHEPDRTGLLQHISPAAMDAADFGQYVGYDAHVSADGGVLANAPTAASVHLRGQRRTQL